MNFLFRTFVIIMMPLSIMAQNKEFTKDNFPANKEELKKALDDIKKGDKYYELGDASFEQALPFYLSANKFNSDNALLNFKIGQGYIYSPNKTPAMGYFEKAYKLDPKVAPDIRYYVGRGNHLNMNWDKAITEYKAYRATLNEKEEQHIIREVLKLINECITGKELIKNPVRVFIDNLGAPVNSKFPEYSPIINADESVMIFTARKDNTTGGQIDEFDMKYFEDVYISYNKDGKWSEPLNIGRPINTDSHDATAGLSGDGQTLFIFDGRKKGGDLFKCMLNGDAWSKPEDLGKNINTEYHESSVCLSPDEKTLYFVSDRPDMSLGGRDIFISKKEKGKWGKPVNLGPTINTPYDEESVFLHPDGKTLYFSSKAHKTMGGYDIFKTVLGSDGKWSEPVNLGYPINTPDDDVFFSLSASGKHGYYSSFRADGVGEKDIYMITFLGAEKPVVLNTEDNLIASIANPVRETIIAPVIEVSSVKTTILKGVITDALTQKPLEAEIELVDNTKNEVIATFRSNSKSGKYLVSLPSGKNYGIAVKKTDYLFHSENFDIPAVAAYQEITKDIALKNIAVGSKIVLRNIFFDFDKFTLRSESTAELERLIKLLTDIPTMRIEISGHTDNKGSAEYNQKLSQNRSKTVVDYLIGKGIAGNRLEYKGYGMTQPIATNDTDEGRQENRRTEFKILSK